MDELRLLEVAVVAVVVVVVVVIPALLLPTLFSSASSASTVASDGSLHRLDRQVDAMLSRSAHATTTVAMGRNASKCNGYISCYEDGRCDREE